jgi:hypothetical protein
MLWKPSDEWETTSFDDTPYRQISTRLLDSKKECSPDTTLLWWSVGKSSQSTKSC